MGIVTVLQPRQLCELANKAKEDMEDVSLAPDTVRDIAENWFRDKQKIEYLESLLLRRN